MVQSALGWKHNTAHEWSSDDERKIQRETLKISNFTSSKKNYFCQVRRYHVDYINKANIQVSWVYFLNSSTNTYGHQVTLRFFSDSIINNHYIQHVQFPCEYVSIVVYLFSELTKPVMSNFFNDGIFIIRERGSSRI